MTVVEKTNQDQRIIIDTIMDLVWKNDSPKTNAFIIDRPGESGKTFIYECLIYLYKLQNFEVSHICRMDRHSVHSRFKLSLNIHEHSISGLKINSKEANNIKNSH